MGDRDGGGFSGHEAPILVIDDQEDAHGCFQILKRNGYRDVTLLRGQKTLFTASVTPDTGLVILNPMVSGMSGLESLPELFNAYHPVPFIMLFESGAPLQVIQNSIMGSFDTLFKPVREELLLAVARRGLEWKRSQEEGGRRHGIVFRGRALRSLFKYMDSVADSPRPVLITGETGAGKELVARAIHERSGRTGPFVAVNTGGLDDTMFSDTLFGHVKGAFTSGDQPRAGLIAKAAEGTLFLDEIGELSQQSQVKLLRLLQEGEYFPLGSDAAAASNARVIVATNKDIEKLQHSGEFRKDLYYRLCAHHIHLPPLRERREDIPPLVDHFLAQAAQAMGKKVPTPPPELAQLLHTYQFPGNVRELEGLIYNAVAAHRGGVLSLESIKEKVALPPAGSKQPVPTAAKPAWGFSAEGEPPLPNLRDAVRNYERALIEEALRRAASNQTLAARLLGISRHALNKRLSRDRQARGETL